jgi:hypothetical protein
MRLLTPLVRLGFFLTVCLPAAAQLNVIRNPQLTPGAVCRQPNATDSCNVPRCYRNVPVSEKKQVFREYGLDYDTQSACCEVDHMIPLELGGSNSIMNLWPEPWPEAHQKDKVENYLHRQVCQGSITVREAQKSIFVWRRFIGPNF